MALLSVYLNVVLDSTILVGTGKSLSIIVSTLHWLINCYDPVKNNPEVTARASTPSQSQSQSQSLNQAQEDSQELSWVTEHYVKEAEAVVCASASC